MRGVSNAISGRQLAVICAISLSVNNDRHVQRRKPSSAPYTNPQDTMGTANAGTWLKFRRAPEHDVKLVNWTWTTGWPVRQANNCSAADSLRFVRDCLPFIH